MDVAVDEQIARISSRIRRWREQEALTLQELAQRGGLATSTVQKVETGQMMPSLAVLLKMARGLGRHVAELLEDGDATVDVHHYKAGAQDVGGASRTLAVVRRSGNLPRAMLETWQVVLDPGVSSGSDPIRYDGEAIVLCEVGTATFRIGNEEYELQTGDSLHFRASIPHSWQNRGTLPTRFTITGTQPLVFRSVMQSRIPIGVPRIEDHREHVESDESPIPIAV